MAGERTMPSRPETAEGNRRGPRPTKDRGRGEGWGREALNLCKFYSCTKSGTNSTGATKPHLSVVVDNSGVLTFL